MKISAYIAKLQANLFTYKLFKHALEVPFEDQYQYLLSLGEPEDDIQRMQFKHKCQMRYGRGISFFLNFFSFFAYPFILIYIYIRKPHFSRESVDLVYNVCFNFDEVHPQQLSDEFPSNIKLDFKNRLLLKNADLKFILKAFLKHKMSLYLLVRFTLKLATYRFIIEKYSPKVIATTNEISPTAVAMTAYCEYNNIEHYNFMHGEKLLTINDSFIHFQRFYIFDEHYKEIFLKLKADISTKFIIHKPYKFCVNLDKYRNVENMVDLTYYLEEFTENEIKNIASSLDMLMEKGYTIRVRPHPRFCNSVLLNKYISSQIIEDNKNVSIYESISSCNMVISLCSAILYQCYRLGVKVVIDNVNDVQAYKNLIDKNYIMFAKPHYLLSEMVKNSKDQFITS